MVDWKEVERLRAKGWDWASVAEEPRVKFSPPEGSGDAGRALKTLYLSRKSQRSRSSRGASVADEETDLRTPASRSWSRRLFLVGAFVAPLAAAWGLVAILVPSPFGIIVTFFPDLVVALILGLALVGGAFVIGMTDLRGAWAKPVAVGIVIGLVGVGLSGYVAHNEGFLTLKACTQYSGGWCHADNPMWSSDNKPVVFFMGSAACPYCSASSWAVRNALEAFGTFSGWQYQTSSPSDNAGPNTPEVTLYGTSLASPYLIWDAQETSDNQVIQTPALNPTEQSYQAAYDPTGSIPFLVFGGKYMHVGTLIDPAVMTTGGSVGTTPYTPQQVDQQIASQSGPVYSAVEAEVCLLEAYFCYIDKLAGISPPAAVLSNPTVASDYQAIPPP